MTSYRGPFSLRAEKITSRAILTKLYSAGGEIDRETRIRCRDILEGM